MHIYLSAKEHSPNPLIMQDLGIKKILRTTPQRISSNLIVLQGLIKTQDFPFDQFTKSLTINIPVYSPLKVIYFKRLSQYSLNTKKAFIISKIDLFTQSQEKEEQKQTKI